MSWQILLIFVLCACTGCYLNRAVIDPYSYACFTPPCREVNPCILKQYPAELLEKKEPYGLDELIVIALKNNPQSKAVWAKVLVSAAAYGQKQSVFFPNITGSFQVIRTRQPERKITSLITPQSTLQSPGIFESRRGTTDMYFGTWGPMLSLSYLLFDFGTQKANAEAARYSLEQAQFQYDNSIQSLLKTVVTDFYTYLYQKELLQANLANVLNAELILDATEQGLHSGVRPLSDFLQAKTQLLSQKTTWASQKQELELALATLLNDIGLPSYMPLQTQELPQELPKNDLILPLETLISIGIQNRADLLSAESALRSQEQMVKMTKRQVLPQFHYQFEIGKTYFSFDGNVTHDTYNFVSTLNLSMPIFSGFYYRNAIKRAELNVVAAEEMLKSLQLNAIKEITVAHSKIHTIFETLHWAAEFLSAAEGQYKVALSGYQKGTQTVLDLLSAQISLVNARTQKAQAMQDWYLALANLSYATGLISPNTIYSLGDLFE
ncbi:MAG: TolC family protein [Chlamydiales bacterium]|jgi:outer membrane protein TolC|nr:TolC family protein [Chlamydiales bacterium]